MAAKKYICDFCNAPDPRWCYPARTFKVLEEQFAKSRVDAQSVEDWAACDACHELMVADKWDALAARASLLLDWPMDFVRMLHKEFQAHRTGPPSKFGVG